MKVLFFAGLKDQLGQESLDWPLAKKTTLGELLELLKSQGPIWQQVLGQGSVLMAVNQQMARANTLLNDSDEVAFFPPVTGG